MSIVSRINIIPKLISRIPMRTHSSANIGIEAGQKSAVKAVSVFSLPEQELIEQFAKQYDFEHQKPKQCRMKRAIDIVGASIGLIVCSPIILVSAALIKLETKGPAIFKQKRIGRFGREFTIYKLRTMHNSPDTNANVRIKNDPRITRVGKYLRKFSVDEFPQFLNILIGDMSIIGPRPQTLISFENTFSKKDPNSLRRFVVRPGASLPYDKPKYDDIAGKIVLEKEYLDNWSFLKDLKCIPMLVKKIVVGGNY